MIAAVDYWLALSHSFAAVGYGLALSNSFAAVGHGLALSNSFRAFRFQLLRFGGEPPPRGELFSLIFFDHFSSFDFSLIFH